ncbi:MAG: carbon-nitrogen hydrolase family protein [Comamonadaceae bacterium]|nr:MAG: carbon-nitrogen hydrolase family protein [Comamonadaceae bacterium]
MTKIQAAVVQAAPAFLDLDASVAQCEALIAQAAREGADLIAFPETFIPGYPWWIWQCAPAEIFARDLVRTYYANALDYASAHATRLAQAARSAGITAVLGLAERDAGSLYISQWAIGPDGQTLLRRRKLKPSHVERSVFGEGDGTDLTVVDSPVGKLGALCCWEHLQPLSKFAMYAQHEQIHVAAWPSLGTGAGRALYSLGYEVNNAASQVYAAEGGCFVLAPCATISQHMVDVVCGDDEKVRARFRAGSGRAMIYGPDGRPLTEPRDPHWEGLIHAELDLTLIDVAKSATDPVGHYARPDVTQLLLNRQPRRAMVETNGAGAAAVRHEVVAQPEGRDEA